MNETLRIVSLRLAFQQLGDRIGTLTCLLARHQVWVQKAYKTIVRIGAKMAQYCARRAPLPMFPLVDGDTVH